MKRKVGRPLGSGPTQLLRAVLFEQVYLAMKELEERGTPLSEVRAEQPEVDPLLTLTKPKKADRKNQSSFHQPGKLLQACRLCSQD